MTFNPYGVSFVRWYTSSLLLFNGINHISKNSSHYLPNLGTVKILSFSCLHGDKANVMKLNLFNGMKFGWPAVVGSSFLLSLWLNGLLLSFSSLINEIDGCEQLVMGVPPPIHSTHQREKLINWFLKETKKVKVEWERLNGVLLLAGKAITHYSVIWRMKFFNEGGSNSI